MNNQMQRGMGPRAGEGHGTTVHCSKCRTEVFRLRPGVVVVERSAVGAVEHAEPCRKCGTVITVYAAVRGKS